MQKLFLAFLATTNALTLFLSFIKTTSKIDKSNSNYTQGWKCKMNKSL
jgi:hypothetical protein